MVNVRIIPKPLLIIELRVKKSFKCSKCWKYRKTVKCKECYPSPAFPLSCEIYPPGDYQEYKKWDSWYIWRYLLEPKEDPEDKYLIGTSYYNI